MYEGGAIQSRRSLSRPVSPPALAEEGLQDFGAGLGQDGAVDRQPVIQPLAQRRVVQEIGGSHPGVRSSENAAVDPRLNHRSQAHDARLERDVEDRADEPMVSQESGRFAQDEHLGMSRGIFSGHGGVPGARHDLASGHEQGADRHLSLAGRTSGAAQSFAKIIFVQFVIFDQIISPRDRSRT